MNFQPLAIPGCVLVNLRLFQDARGLFVKTFLAEAFAAHGLHAHFTETFYSTSHHNVLRGLHFQLPPHDHAKLVTCVAGAALDVVVDVRRGSPTFGQALSIPLDAAQPQAVYIPSGCAHGFYTVSASATLLYQTSVSHVPTHDAGIRWDSIPLAWPSPAPIVSERDQRWPTLAEFASPFTYTP